MSSFYFDIDSDVDCVIAESKVAGKQKGSIVNYNLS
jgi:hypothetical protein